MMHLSGILVVALLVVLIPAVVFAIQDGTDVTDPTTFPYYVMLGNPHVCGGVILLFNPAIILTAAHCVVDAPHPLSLTTRHNPYFVGYGDIDRKSQTINTITDWIVHPDYEDSNGQVDMHHDIAIVKLQKPLKPSDTVARVALWSAKDFDIPRQAELMGYGYTRIDKPEAPTLQRIAVNVTRFTAGYSDMVEAMSSHDSEMACHGDSGSPLIVHKQVNATTTSPVAVGLLARIFGVYDQDPNHATCPVPFRIESEVPTIIESFCNLSNMLRWIADETGLAVEQLTDPGFVPNNTCYEDCHGRWRGTRLEEGFEDEDNEKDSGRQWHIGFGDRTFQKNHPDKWFIGPLVQQRQQDFHTSTATTITVMSLYSSSLLSSLLLLTIITVVVASIFEIMCI